MSVVSVFILNDTIDPLGNKAYFKCNSTNSTSTTINGNTMIQEGNWLTDYAQPNSSDFGTITLSNGTTVTYSSYIGGNDDESGFNYVFNLYSAFGDDSTYYGTLSINWNNNNGLFTTQSNFYDYYLK